MAVTPEQIVDSLIRVAYEMLSDLQEFESEMADNYDGQLEEIMCAYKQMTNTGQ